MRSRRAVLSRDVTRALLADAANRFATDSADCGASSGSDTTNPGGRPQISSCAIPGRRQGVDPGTWLEVSGSHASQNPIHTPWRANRRIDSGKPVRSNKMEGRSRLFRPLSLSSSATTV